MDKFLDIMKQLKKRPFMYIDGESLEQLYFFIIGYLTCQSTDGPDYSELDLFWTAFDDFVHKKYKNNLSISSRDVILQNVPDTKKAFYRFFELLEEFEKVYDK